MSWESASCSHWEAWWDLHVGISSLELMFLFGELGQALHFSVPVEVCKHLTDLSDQGVLPVWPSSEGGDNVYNVLGQRSCDFEGV